MYLFNSMCGWDLHLGGISKDPHLKPPHPIAGSPGLLRRRSPPPVAHGPCLSGPGQWPVPCRKI